MSKGYKELLEEFRDDMIDLHEVEPNTDTVNFDDAINPNHYKFGNIETIDYMKAISTDQEYQGHLRLTAIKYLSRLGRKDKASQEVAKAIWYLKKLKESLEEGEAFFC